MKKTILLIAFAISMIFTEGVQAQKFPKIDASVHDIAYYRVERDAAPIAKVIYGRPLKKGREIFGALVPFGQVWRTGANEATEIKFYKDVKLGDKDIKAGTYTLFSIPGPSEWTIILNSDTDVWGAYSYKEENDVARIQVPVKKENESLEAFSIAFKLSKTGADMILGWDTTRVAVPINN